ncbi:unnamed protein product [Blepharisma stoltei]|uniref:RNA helicase n=1 Tax=Blepharisma stoltei TaxID=1481888 RepID=A0AAU9K5S2_9CILI|nr:unnamed protein product [Blepharisma stoltei]
MAEKLNDNSIQSHSDETAQDFRDMGLKEDVLRGIFSAGFETPSIVQQRTIKIIAKGSDMIIQSKSGSGKTAALIIGMLQLINPNINQLQAIILEPCREIAKETYSQIAKLGEYVNVKAHSVFGGIYYREDIIVLKNCIHILVCTPGRMLDYLRKDLISASGVKIFILNKIDELLTTGFKDQIIEIFQFLPESAQVCFSSSTTIPSDVSEMAEIYMKNPVIITLKINELTLDGIKQYYIQSEVEAKFAILEDLLNAMQISQAAIFCNTKISLETLVQSFQDSHYSVSFLHSDIDDRQKEVAMRNFRTGSTRILIATDLIRNFIDIYPSVFIHYDFPFIFENYITRVGRSGAYGHRGLSICFITQSEFQFLKELESHFSTIIEELPNDVSSLL